jgi:predicted nucleic acid-binding protein
VDEITSLGTTQRRDARRVAIRQASNPRRQGCRRDLGDLSAAATQRGRPRPVNDTWVAACCLAYRLPLATFNIKDYSDFAEHDGLEIVGHSVGEL